MKKLAALLAFLAPALAADFTYNVTAGPSVGAVFTATVPNGVEPITYEWFKDGVKMTDGAVVSIPLLEPKHSGTWVAKAVDASGPAESPDRIILTVVLPPAAPVITAAFSNATALKNQPFRWPITATGDGLRYQWKKSGTNIPGATTATLAISSVKPRDAGTYAVRVWNDNGAVEVSAKLTVR